MLNAGFYLLEKRHGVPAVWKSLGSVQDFNTATGEVIRDSAEHQVPRGIFCKNSVSSFEKLAMGIGDNGGKYDFNSLVFMMRTSYLPPNFNINKIDTNGTLVIKMLEYKINEIDINNGIAIIKLSRSQ
jgi:hypothetical protein